MIKTLPRSFWISLRWVQVSQSPASSVFFSKPEVYKIQIRMTASKKRVAPKIVPHAEFAVIGIEARTTNAREMTAEGVIPKQWERLLKNNLLAQIPHKADSSIIVVYTDYESDENGAYTYVLGAKVSSVSDFPPGMVVRQIPAAHYAVFTSDRGPVTKVVFEAWKRIWAQPQTPDYHRSYQADFEVYDERAVNPADTQIDIYVGLR